MLQRLAYSIAASGPEVPVAFYLRAPAAMYRSRNQ